MNYHLTSFKKWKEDPEKNSELPMLSLFMQLNYGESDLMASFEEMEPIFPNIDGALNEDEIYISPLTRAQKAFDKHQDGKFLNFRQFQAFLKEVDLEEKADYIDNYHYMFYFKRNCCTMCLGKCCGRKLRDIRMKQVANRLKRLVEVENKMFSPMPIDFV